MWKALKLAIAFLREHRVRTALTSLATISAATLVIWIASGYDALLKTFDDYANLALGRYTLSIAPIARGDDQYVPPEVLVALRNDPAIAVADAMHTFRVKVRLKSENRSSAAESQKQSTTAPPSPADLGFEGGPGSGPTARLPDSLLLATSAPLPPFDLAEGVWINESVRGVVVRADVAQERVIAVNDLLVLEFQDRAVELPVVGIIQAPTLAGAGEAAIPILSPSTGEFFVSESVATELLPNSPKISLIGISLRSEADLTKFRFGWAPRLSRYSTPVQFQEAFEIEEALDQAASAENVKLQAWSATALGMLVALLTILSTLNIGVNERVRQYAILRSLSFTRLQIGVLIVFEGLLLGGIGFLGGTVVSGIVLQMTAATSMKILHHGAALGPNSLLLATVAAFGGALTASLIPAWRAMRVRPIDAMAPLTSPLVERPGSPVVIALAIALIAVNPLLTFVFPPRFEGGVYGTLAIGFLSMSIGFLLLAPTVVRLVDRYCGPLVARLFVVDRKLLASQLTSHLWRTIGVALSMAVGLAMFIGIQVWGTTMLAGFIPGPWAPDALLSFRPSGLSFETAAKVASIPGINGKRCQPIVVEQPRLLNDLTHSADRASVTRQDNVVLVGIDPTGAFAGEHPLFDLDWVEGSPAAAVEMMRQGRACIVPDHFLAETGLRIGDSFTLVAPDDPAQTPRYRIAGAVRLPGWHWQTKLTGFRTRTHRAAALLFADLRSVSNDFHLPQASHVWFSYDSTATKPEEIAAAAQRLYEIELGRDVKIGSADDDEPAVRIMPIQGIRDFLQNVARRWIWGASQIPLIATGIAALGLLNVMLASVRSRAWEFGVLRSIGITAAATIRAVLAEGLLIGIVALVLSLAFGMLAGWCGCGIAQYISFFGGLHPDLVIPWRPISMVAAAVLALAVAAAVWPAVTIGRTRPLELLQRSSS